MSDVKIGLVQMRCEKGAIEQNIAQIKFYVKEALEQKVDFVCFPEMSLTGYIDPTKQPQAMLSLDGPEVSQIVKLTIGNNLTLMAGLVEINPAGEKPYITQFIAKDGKLIGSYRKITIEDEEIAWFSAGEKVQTFEHPLGRFGLAICADINNPQVFADNASEGAKIIFEMAAPGLYGEQATRNWDSGFEWWQQECQTKLAHYAHENKVYIAVATQAGRTIDEDFPGGGYIFDPNGECIAATPDWSAGVLYATLTL